MFSRSRTVRNWSFVVLLVALVASGAAQEALASDCGSIHYSPDGFWYSNCGWYSSDPCADNTAAYASHNDCFLAFRTSGTVYSCYAPGGDGLYYWSYADCVCSG